MATHVISATDPIECKEPPDKSNPRPPLLPNLSIRDKLSNKQEQPWQTRYINNLRRPTKLQLREHKDGVAHTTGTYVGRVHFYHIFQVTLQAFAVRAMSRDVVGWLSLGLDVARCFSVGLDRREQKIHGRRMDVRSGGVSAPLNSIRLYNGKKSRRNNGQTLTFTQSLRSTETPHLLQLQSSCVPQKPAGGPHLPHLPHRSRLHDGAAHYPPFSPPPPPPPSPLSL